jgi:hypothetical protein
MCGELRLGDLVVRVDRRGVGAEAEHHAGAVAAEAPDRGRDLAVGLGGQAVEVALALGVGKRAALEVRRADVMPGDLLVGSDREAVDGLRRGFGGGLGLLGGEGGADAEEGEEEGGGTHESFQSAEPTDIASARISASGFS